MPLFRVLIIGGGIGGLALARALQLKEAELNPGDRRPAAGSVMISVRVLERDASMDCRAQGYSLTIQDGMKALQQMGLSDEVRSCAGGLQSSSGQHVINPVDGKVIFALGGKKKKPNSQKSAVGKNRNVFIPRQRLRRILLESLRPGTVEWGKSLAPECLTRENLVSGSSPLQLLLTDGSVCECDMLVAADGVRSSIRKTVLPDDLNFLGVLAVNGITACNNHPLFAGGSAQVLDGKGTRLFVKPFDELSQGQDPGWPANDTKNRTPRVMWQLTRRMERAEVDSWTTRGPQALVEDQLLPKWLSHWHSSVKDFVLQTPIETMRCGGIFDRDPDALRAIPSKDCRVAFLGDAAHPMSPFKGQGANQALLDAVEMADRLGEMLGGPQKSSPAEALSGVLSEFHDSMCRRVSRFVLGSRRNVVFTHSVDAGRYEGLCEHFGVRDAKIRAEQEARAAIQNEFLSRQGLISGEGAGGETA